MAERKTRGATTKSKDDAQDVISKRDILEKLSPPTKPPRNNSGKKIEEPKKETPPPAMDPKQRENQMVNLAVALAEKQLRDGTASSAVITHYLKLATSKEQLERTILEKQSKLIEAKADSIVEAKKNKNSAQEAIEAMRRYNPGG